MDNPHETKPFKPFATGTNTIVQTQEYYRKPTARKEGVRKGGPFKRNQQGHPGKPPSLPPCGLHRRLQHQQGQEPDRRRSENRLHPGIQRQYGKTVSAPVQDRLFSRTPELTEEKYSYKLSLTGALRPFFVSGSLLMKRGLFYGGTKWQDCRKRMY